MSERIHSAMQISASPSRSNSKNTFLVVGGTAAVAFLAGFMFQFARPAIGQAQEKAPTGKATVTGAKSEPTRYLARISNGKNVTMVTYDEVAHECMLRHGNDVLDNIINRKVIETACLDANVEISEADVDQEIIKVAKKFNMSVEEWYSMLQAERNVTKAQYRRDIIWPMLALRKLAGTDVKVTKSELAQAFQRSYGPRVKARIIVQDNQRRAAEAWDMVNKDPTNFENAVKKYSIDPGSRALGGAIPPIPANSGNPLSEPIEQAAFKLKAGEISSVIQSGQQFIIIKCEGRTEQVVQSIEEVQDQLIAELREEKTQRAVADTFDKIRENARIDNYLTKQTTGLRNPNELGGNVPGGIRQTGGTAPAGKATNPARPAVGTRPNAPTRG